MTHERSEAGLSATRQIDSDELTPVTKKTLYEVKEAVNRAQDELERAEAAL